MLSLFTLAPEFFPYANGLNESIFSDTCKIRCKIPVRFALTV